VPPAENSYIPQLGERRLTGACCSCITGRSMMHVAPSKPVIPVKVGT